MPARPGAAPRAALPGRDVGHHRTRTGLNHSISATLVVVVVRGQSYVVMAPTIPSDDTTPALNPEFLMYR